MLRCGRGKKETGAAGVGRDGCIASGYADQRIKEGMLELVGTDEEVIYREVIRLLTAEIAYQARAHAGKSYGGGWACVGLPTFWKLTRIMKEQRGWARISIVECGLF